MSQKAAFAFRRTIKQVFRAADQISQAAFLAKEIEAQYSQRAPVNQDVYIDVVTFDTDLFNRRASLLLEVLIIKSLFHEAGLDEFARYAIERLIDAKLGPSSSTGRGSISSR